MGGDQDFGAAFLAPTNRDTDDRKRRRRHDQLAQRRRHDAARHILGERVVMPGEVLPTDSSVLRGHGTHQVTSDDGTKRLRASVSGVIERISQLVSVRPVTQRYVGAVGDVVVGRVLEIAGKRWKVDVNGRQDAMLLLSSVNLPGGIQRRRSYEDELRMRDFLAEGDIVSAEVQMIARSDGSVSLHTRSLKYGKLGSGQFIAVPTSLIKRSKSHFHTLPYGVDVILGVNGYCFVSPTAKVGVDVEEHRLSMLDIDAERRKIICRVRNAIVLLARKNMYIHPRSVMAVYEASLSLEPKQMLEPMHSDGVIDGASELLASIASK